MSENISAIVFSELLEGLNVSTDEIDVIINATLNNFANQDYRVIMCILATVIRKISDSSPDKLVSRMFLSSLKLNIESLQKEMKETLDT